MTEARLVLRAAASHLYPGARGAARGTVSGPAPGAARPCLVEFADGSATLATLAPEGGDCVLTTAPYRTARGTVIAARRWVVRFDEGGKETRFRVLRRAGRAASAR